MKLPQNGVTSFTYYALQTKNSFGWTYVVPPVLAERMAKLRDSTGEHGFSELGDAVKAAQTLKFLNPMEYSDDNLRVVEVRVEINVTPKHAFIITYGQMIDKERIRHNTVKEEVRVYTFPPKQDDEGEVIDTVPQPEV